MTRNSNLLACYFGVNFLSPLRADTTLRLREAAAWCEVRKGEQLIMAQAPPDVLTVTVLTVDLDLIDELAELGDGVRLRVDEPRHFPGAVDTFGQIVATLRGVDLGVAESLIAAWIWEARIRTRSRQPPPTAKTGIKVRLRVCRPGGEIEFEVEADTQEGVKDIIATTLANARLDG